MCLFRFSILCFCVNSSACFARVLFAFVVLGLVSSVLYATRLAAWEDRIRSDPFCVEWDVKS